MLSGLKFNFIGMIFSASIINWAFTLNPLHHVLLSQNPFSGCSANRPTALGEKFFLMGIASIILKENAH
jgi:hypothetical protein